MYTSQTVACAAYKTIDVFVDVRLTFLDATTAIITEADAETTSAFREVIYALLVIT